MSKIMRICVTGKMCSGKSTFMEVAKQTKCNTFVVDEFISEIYKPGKIGFRKIIKKFGIRLADENGINKKKLLELILNNKNNEEILMNKIINPLIFKRIKKISKRELWFIELGTYLKYEEYFKPLFDKVILVRCDTNKWKTLLKNKYRNLDKNHPGITTDDSKIKYDYLIENNYSKEEFYEYIRKFLSNTIF